MTKEKLKTLNTLEGRFKDAEQLERGMKRELQREHGGFLDEPRQVLHPGREQYEQSVRYVIGNRSDAITESSWITIYKIICNDVEAHLADTKDAFERA